MKSVIHYFNLDLGSPEKNDEFFKSLHNLITILFAVVFGVGLQKYGSIPTLTTDQYLFLSLVFIVILQSWWGYHLGIIKGPDERNEICYFIDVLLLVLYWFMIECFRDVNFLLLLFTIMFLLYFLWELIRYLNPSTNEQYKKVVKKAMIANLIFTIFFSLITLAYFLILTPNYRPTPLILIIILLGLFIGYRMLISNIYKQR